MNSRMMRDRLINHAIRGRNGEDKLGADQLSLRLCLYLEIDPHQVNVNVHPAKHSAFSSIPAGARLHLSELLSVLQQQTETTLPLEEVRQRRVIPGKPYRRRAQPFAVPAGANCGASHDTALFRRRIGR